MEKEQRLSISIDLADTDSYWVATVTTISTRTLLSLSWIKKSLKVLSYKKANHWSISSDLSRHTCYYTEGVFMSSGKFTQDKIDFWCAHKIDFQPSVLHQLSFHTKTRTISYMHIFSILLLHRRCFYEFRMSMMSIQCAYIFDFWPSVSH